MLPNPFLFDVALTLGIAVGILSGVALAQMARGTPPKATKAESAATPPQPAETVEDQDSSPETQFPPEEEPAKGLTLPVHFARMPPIPHLEWMEMVRVGTAGAGLLALVFVMRNRPAASPTLLAAAIGATFFLAAAGLSATAGRYLADIDPARFPEAPGLCRGARVLAWILVVGVLSCGLAWAGMETILRILGFVVLGVDAIVCYSLLRARPPKHGGPHVFPLDLAVLSVLGGRSNPLASVLDSAQAQLGIDLRSTWALTVVRRSLEPLVISLCLLAWLSTSLTVVGVEELGLVERLGVPAGGDPLPPGLHLHWPWPMDRVFRVPVKRVQTIEVGHEGEEGSGPENVLWAVEHAANEYTLLLGNGRDLITIDATVQFRIADARAWRYHSQNPAEALKAIAYRAVMRNTVNRTLSEALSENIAALTARMRGMVQSDADALGLGVEIVDFTVGGMHPPVPVAADYEAVVSAELAKATAMVDAQVFRNQTVPAAETEVLMSVNEARSQGAESLAQAAGQAWSFRVLESQFRAAPQEYYFRRRLETLEKGLSGRPFTILDSRFQRDGGELWLMP
ncbi:MAG TPA: protease modulator HflK [Bryobacteraceae bacterium]|nr:protease modulator HflK [Bryobacteraceae bacterium]